MKNPAKLYIRDSFYEAAQMFAAGAALTQTYMAALGLPERMIGTVVSAMSIVNIAASVIFSKFSDNSKNTQKSLSALFAVIAATYLFFTLFSFRLDLTLTLTFILLIAAGFVQSVSIAVRNLYEYKLPFLMFNMDKYAHYVTLDGVIAGVFGVLFSVTFNIVMHQFEYFTAMRAGFFFAFLMTALAAGANQQFVLKTRHELSPHISAAPTKLSSIIKHRDFAVLALPNFLRGIAGGVVNMAALIALNSNILDRKGTAYIVTATTVGNIAGSLLYTIFSRRVDDKTMCLVGSALMFPMVFMGSTGPVGYVTMFFFANLGLRTISHAYPLMVYKLISFEIIGTYNTLRMILTTTGTAAATYLTGRLLGSIPVWSFFVVAYIGQVISAAFYLHFFPKLLAEKELVLPASTGG